MDRIGILDSSRPDDYPCRVSVIIPVYNVEPYIEECLDSVRNQTLRDLEILCIDDCSTDGSWALVERAAGEDERIRLERNPKNLGLASTRNAGLSLARGEYVYFLDADDRILPEALEKLEKAASEERLDAVVFCASFVFEDDALKERFYTNPAVFKGSYPDTLSGKELYVKWMQIWDWIPSQPRFFYRRAFLEEFGIRFVDGMLHEDESFAFDVLMHARRIQARPEQWFVRRFRENSIMTARPTMKNVEGCITILQHIAASFSLFRQDEALSEAVNFYRKKIAAGCLLKYREAKGIKEGFDVTGERQKPDSLSGHPVPGFSVTGADPLVSVLIPVYNVRPYLEECLTSVLSQSLTDLEVICVDDGSTDDSLDLLLEYEKMDPRIRVIPCKENRGQAVARNLALSQARGRAVYMLDADDWIMEDALKTLYGKMEEEDLDVIGFENRQFTDDEAFASQAATVLFSYATTEGLYTGKEAFITCVEKDTLSPSVPTFMMKRDFVVRSSLRFEEGILHEDIGFIFEMLTRAERVRLLHRPFFARRFRAQSTVTRGFSAKHALGYLKSWQTAWCNRPMLRERFGEDEAFWHAFRKWERDVAGRIRILYSSAQERIYKEEATDGGFVSQVLLEMMRQTTSGSARAEDILGKEMTLEISGCPAVYICGSGQYAHRMLDVIGSLPVEIRGILEEGGEVQGRKTFRGFRVLDPVREGDRSLPVVMAVSHYRQEGYIRLLKEAGYEKLLSVTF